MSNKLICGKDAAVVLKWRTAEQSVVKGMNRLTPPVVSRDTQEVEFFGDDYTGEVTTGAKISRITFSGLAMKGDVKGQDLLSRYLDENSEITNCVFMLNKEDFYGLDLARAPEGYFQVVTANIGEATPGGLYPFNGEMTVFGRVAKYSRHLTADTLSFTAGSAGVNDTIADSGNGFVDAGFQDGDTLIVHGDASNNGYYIIKTVEAGTLTLESEGELTTASAGSLIELDGGRI